MDLSRLQQQISHQQDSIPPVESWNPDFCGDIDLHIKHDGTWHYMGTPIGRKALVRLFSTVLKREDSQYFLVTPVEKVGIQVEDVPFLVTQWQMNEGQLVFTTKTEDTFVVGPDHPVALRQDNTSKAILPYALVRRNLWARLHQNVFYQLVERGHEGVQDGQLHLLLSSGDYSFSLGKL